MHPFQTVLLALVVAAVAFSAWTAFRASIEERRAKRERAGARSEGLRDPETCEHVWERWDSGTCMPSYSSYGGPDPQETWEVERCPLCGARRFSCTGACDCYAECAATHEG